MGNVIIFALMIFMAFIIGALICATVLFVEVCGFWHTILGEIRDMKKRIIADVILHIIVFGIGIPAVYIMAATGAFTHG